MLFRVRTTHFVRCSSAAALAVAVHAFAPADALASCGDWLAGHGHVAAAAAEPETTGTLPWANGARAHQWFGAASRPLPDGLLPDGPPPCRGPSCRHAPEAPPPAPAPRTQTGQEDRWFSPPVEPLPPASGVVRLAWAEPLELSAGFRHRVERPPR